MRQTSDLRQDPATASPVQGRLIESLDPVRSWQPCRIGASAYLEHLHVLAWLVSVLRPGHSICLGVGQGVAYFALCQAVSEAGLDARLFGIDLWRPASSDTFTSRSAQVPEALREHNQQHYARLSRLICADPAGAAEIFDVGGIDLLLVDQDLSAGMLENLLSQWSPLMSPAGVIVLRGLKAARKTGQTRTALQALTRSVPHLELAAGGGLLLLLVGEAPAEALALAAGLPGDSPDRAALEQTFIRLGAQLHDVLIAENNRVRLDSLTSDLACMSTALAEAITARDTADAQAKTLQDSLTKAAARLADRDMVLAARTGELEKSQRERDSLTALIDARATELLAVTRIAETLRAEVQQRSQDHEEALSRQATDFAAERSRQAAEAVAILAGRDMALAARALELEKSQRERDSLTALLEARATDLLAVTRIAETLRAEVQQRSQDYEAAATTLDQVRAELARKDKAFDADRAVHSAEAAARLAEHEAALAERTAELQKSQRERDNLTADLVAVTRIAETLRAEVQRRSQDHEAAATALDQVRAELARKDKAFEAERVARGADAAARVAERDAAALTDRQLKEVLRERAALSSALEKRNAEIAALTRKAESLRSTLEQSHKKHEVALEQAQAELARHAEEIQALRSSTSWKVTAPLRRAKLAVTERKPNPSAQQI